MGDRIWREDTALSILSRQTYRLAGTGWKDLPDRYLLIRYRTISVLSPMPTELKLQWTGEDWSLLQLPTRIIEIYSGGQKLGSLSGMTAGRKTLEWSGGETNLELGILCFILGRYMQEDDTCWVV